MSRPSSNSRPRLNHTAVVEAAIRYANEHGLDELSMRRLADNLDVTPMALYKHVAGREQLIDAMVEAVASQIDAAREGESWKQALRTRILSARTLTQRHLWMQTAIETRTLAGPAVLGYMDDLMTIMKNGGLNADLVHYAMHSLSTRMWGFTRDVLPTPEMPDDPAEHRAALMAYATEYPSIVWMATTAKNAGAACDSDAEFQFALDILLDAFERLHEKNWASTTNSY